MISMACMDGSIARTALVPCCNHNNSSPTTRLLAVRASHFNISCYSSHSFADSEVPTKRGCSRKRTVKRCSLGIDLETAGAADRRMEVSWDREIEVS